MLGLPNYKLAGVGGEAGNNVTKICFLSHIKQLVLFLYNMSFMQQDSISFLLNFSDHVFLAGLVLM